MTEDSALTWWWLNVLNRRRFDALSHLFGDLDTALEALDFEMLRQMGVRELYAQQTMKRLEVFDPPKVRHRMSVLGVSLCSIEDEVYPAQLREIADPPIFLSWIGDISILEHPCIAVVGTRRMSPYGRRVVETFVPAFARSSLVTVSGLALGIDAAVAKDTMEAGGKTVAALGHGLSTIYPKANERLAAKIVANGGLLLSEFPLDVQPDTYTFPARNRIIAGLSLGTLVAEAPASSGAIITAELALEYGRDVFAVPGPIFDEHAVGCHKLIADGHARLVTIPTDVLRELGIIASPDSPRPLFTAASPEQQSVYDALSGMPQTMDDLVPRTKLDAPRVGTALTMMELAGVVKNVGGGQWVRL